MREKGKVFTLGYLANLITWRQKNRCSDTIIFIYGARRTGKTNLGFRILFPILKNKRAEYAAGTGTWDVPHFWKEHFEKYFGSTAEDVKDKIMNNEDETYIFLDEGDDALSWHEQMDRQQQALTRTFLKSGKKKITCIIITPNISILQKNILSCGHYFLWITRDPDIKKKHNYALVFKNHQNQVLREKNPFGLMKILKKIEKNESMDDTDKLERYLMRQRRYVSKVYFKEIDPKLYRLYEKLVKDPLILEENKRTKYVKISEFEKIRYALQTMIYNLDFEQQKPARICNLLRDKYGRQTLSRTTVQNWIEEIHALENKPDIIEDEEEIKKKRFSDQNAPDMEVTV